MATAAEKTTPKKPAVKAAPSAPKKAETEAQNPLAMMTDQFESAFAAFTDNTDTMREQAEDVMQTMRSNMEQTGERMQALNTDVVNAARDEISGAVDLANDLAQAKTLADAMELQRDYWTSLFETRMEFARNMTSAAVDTMRESAEPLQEAFNAPAMEKFFPFASPFTAK